MLLPLFLLSMIYSVDLDVIGETTYSFLDFSTEDKESTRKRMSYC